jgi:hypothetical protein
MTTVAFTRSSDAPPPMLDTLDVDEDGSWRAWRSVGETIGRFSGSDLGSVVGLARRAAAEPPPTASDVPADATLDRLELGDGHAVAIVGVSTRPTGAWGDLFDACREAIEDATTHPTAAISIVVLGHDRVRLEHRGTDMLPVELGRVQAQASLWTTAGAFLATGTGGVDLGRVEAGPGWSVEIPLEGIDPTLPGGLVVSVSFVADDGGVFIPVMLAAGRGPG